MILVVVKSRFSRIKCRPVMYDEHSSASVGT